MKYRVREEIYYNGKSTFIVQKNGNTGWRDVETISGNYLMFNTLEEAVERANSFHLQSVKESKIHEIG
jgi:hypothetical protein